MSLIATHSGLRAPAGELTHDVLDGAVAGLASLLATPTVAIARDDRASGEELVEVVSELALAWGIDVVDAGVAATPAVKVLALRRGLGGAIIVTASHLEPDRNGLKFVSGPDMRPVDMRTLPDAPGARPAARGALSRDGGAAEEHVAAICAAIDEAAIRASGLAVAWEGGAGDSAALLVERLARGARSADITLRLDPDGDRVVLTDERGVALDPELTLALALIARDARCIVKGADTSRALDALAAERGAQLHVVPPGELHLFDRLRAVGGDLAGEGNGGVIVPAMGPGRDGLAAGAAVVDLVARTGRPLSELVEQVPSLRRRRSTVACADPGAALASIERLARDAGLPPPDRWSGAEVEDGEAWGLVRLSATEPVIRITTEAPGQDAADALHAKLEAALR